MFPGRPCRPASGWRSAQPCSIVASTSSGRKDEVEAPVARRVEVGELAADHERVALLALRRREVERPRARDRDAARADRDARECAREREHALLQLGRRVLRELRVRVRRRRLRARARPVSREVARGHPADATEAGREAARAGRAARPGRAPVVVGRQPARRVRPRGALRVRVAAPRRVSLRRDQHVLAHGVELPAAERAAICCGLEALRPAHAPPARLRVVSHRPRRMTVCGVDVGSLRTPAAVAWLDRGRFVLDSYVPSTARPLPEPPAGMPAPSASPSTPRRACPSSGRRAAPPTARRGRRRACFPTGSPTSARCRRTARSSRPAWRSSGARGSSGCRSSRRTRAS